MQIYEVILGVLVIAASVCVTGATLLSKSDGKGLSGIVGAGYQSEMNSRKKNPREVMLTRVASVSAAAYGALIVILGAVTAHLN